MSFGYQIDMVSHHIGQLINKFSWTETARERDGERVEYSIPSKKYKSNINKRTIIKIQYFIYIWKMLHLFRNRRAGVDPENPKQDF